MENMEQIQESELKEALKNLNNFKEGAYIHFERYNQCKSNVSQIQSKIRQQKFKNSDTRFYQK